MVNTVRGSLETLILGIVGLTTGVGVYAAAARLSSVGNMFYLSIGNISTPIIADLHSHGETSPLKAYYQTTTRWLLTFNLPLFLTFLLFAKPLLSIFGEDFMPALPHDDSGIWHAGIYCHRLGANTLDMTDHPKVNTTNSVLLFFLTIALNLFLVPQWGVVGASIATSVSVVLVNVICLIESLGPTRYAAIQSESSQAGHCRADSFGSHIFAD